MRPYATYGALSLRMSPYACVRALTLLRVAALLGAWLLYCCFTAALLLLYCCFTSACVGLSLRGVAAERGACFTALLLLYYCFTTALLIYCFTALLSSRLVSPASAWFSCCFTALLLLYCFTALLCCCYCMRPSATNWKQAEAGCVRPCATCV